MLCSYAWRDLTSSTIATKKSAIWPSLVFPYFPHQQQPAETEEHDRGRLRNGEDHDLAHRAVTAAADVGEVKRQERCSHRRDEINGGEFAIGTAGHLDVANQRASV